MHAHLVFVTKYRHRVFTDRHLSRMEEIMRAVCAGFETELESHYWRAERLWSGSYFAGSVGGAPIGVLRQYIEDQKRPSRGAGVCSDPIHLWRERRSTLGQDR
ncbi:transposase [Nocardiopsis tropica]|uniref:Transposase n=1 Tax=Nocardiopsis tropica TaxID=109330 RepID=A0ABV2A2Y9_9ACTN